MPAKVQRTFDGETWEDDLPIYEGELQVIRNPLAYRVVHEEPLDGWQFLGKSLFSGKA